LKFDSNGWLDQAIEYDYTHRSESRQGHKIKYVVIHGTAGGTSAEGIAVGFRDGDRVASAHLIIDQQGKIAQGIPLRDAAWANGILGDNRAPFIPSDINPNLYTAGIEFVKESRENLNELTPIQFEVGFEVIMCVCDTYDIPKRSGDANGGILAHWDISATACPGPFPWNELWLYLKGGQKPEQKPVQPTAHQIRAADDAWCSVIKDVAKGTGIYKAWFASLTKNKFYGPPITREYTTVDWNGNRIITQEFAHARCEWTGNPNWYGPSGKA